MVIGDKKEMVGSERGCLRNKENFEEVEVTAKVCYFPCKVARCCLRRFHVRMLEKQRELRGGGGYCVVCYFPFKDARCFL